MKKLKRNWPLLLAILLLEAVIVGLVWYLFGPNAMIAFVIGGVWENLEETTIRPAFKRKLAKPEQPCC